MAKKNLRECKHGREFQTLIPKVAKERGLEYRVTKNGDHLTYHFPGRGLCTVDGAKEQSKFVRASLLRQLTKLGLLLVLLAIALDWLLVETAGVGLPALIIGGVP